MKSTALAFIFLLVPFFASAQNVSVIGPIIPGNCPQFSSTTIIKDSGFNCNGSPAVSFANPTGAVGLTSIPGTATTAMRSDAAPPLSASVQSALTGTNNLPSFGTGAFGFTTRSLIASDLPLGVPTNTRSSYTSTNSLATTDCGKTVALGGSAFFTFTVNAASSYNSSCAVIITNEDNVCPLNGASTCRGKNIAINGYASFILWPGQTFTLVNQNNVWQYVQPGRWQPLVGMTWHINHATGSDSSDGLGTTGAGEFATLQHCVSVMESLIDFGQSDVGPTCQNDNETFTENNVVHTHPLTGYHVISITGNTGSPGSVTWQVSGSGNTAIQCRDTGLAIVTGFTFVSTGSGNNFIQAGQLAVCDFGYDVFGANSGGADIHLTPGGSANFFGGTLSITGSMNSFASIDAEGHFLVDGATITMPNALTYSAFLIMTGPGDASMTSMTFSGTGSAGGSTGAQYSIAPTSQLNVTSTTLPGASTGVVNPFTGPVLSSSPAGGVGYTTGAGGAVTQLTSRTTGVTLNKITGAITLFAAAPTVGTWVSFTVTDSSVAATDVPHVAFKSGTNTYIGHVTAVAAGSFQISFTSIVGTSLDSPVINFAIIKGSAT